MFKTIFCFGIFQLLTISLVGQQCYWQQHVDYKMSVELDIFSNTYSGHQILTYKNNSPDTLVKVFYHLYFNAFKPGSDMDTRSRNLPDPDPRVKDRILKLPKSDQGYMDIKTLTLDGKEQQFEIEETILEVTLTKPILPNSEVVLEMDFEGQVPIMVRRAGRFNKEDIEYSMAQWYPKLCNYDTQGWHANPYIGREFYGIWGDFEVKITLPSKYTVAATGILQNRESLEKPKKNDSQSIHQKKTWHFVAKNVHDFVWAADPEYVQISKTAYDGTILRFYYQPGEKTDENWKMLPDIMDEALKFMNLNYGQYAYPEYAFIQGGDGGMEYAMATLITGERNFVSLVGVSVHEMVHSWFQMMLATNESLYHWMDEGFTSYAESEVMNHLRKLKKIPGDYEENPHLQSILGYENFARSGSEESLITHADHFNTNTAYSVAAYVKGEVLLEELKYIIGEKAFNAGLKQYFSTWKFKHPTTNDFFRVMEKSSGLELDWFKEYFVNSTHTIDYGVEKMEDFSIILKRKGRIPMPLDITVIDKDNKEYRYHIPIDLMRGVKAGDGFFNNFTVSHDWHWVYPTYRLKIDVHESKVKKVYIDYSNRLADVDRSDNIFPYYKPDTNSIK
ncbi:MAG: M1 family metallopeptidase [Saprospiraceae bacterium]